MFAVGTSAEADHVTFIDSIKVYSKTKQEFGWSEEAAAAAIQESSTNRTQGTTQRANEDQSGDETSLTETADVNPSQLATPVDR